MDRYAYVNNSPVNFVDPTGHSTCKGKDHWDDGPECAQRVGSDLNIDIQVRKYMYHHDLTNLFPKATGSNKELNITLGIPLQTKTNGTVFLLYFSVGAVTDNSGNIQLYYSTLDQKYISGEGFVGDGVVRSEGKNSAYGFSVSLSGGPIYGEGFTTKDFLGEGYVSSLPVGPLPASFSVSGPQDPELDYTGYEIGPSAGFSMGSAYIDTKGIVGINLAEVMPKPIATSVCFALFLLLC